MEESLLGKQESSEVVENELPPQRCRASVVIEDESAAHPIVFDPVELKAGGEQPRAFVDVG